MSDLLYILTNSFNSMFGYNNKAPIFIVLTFILIGIAYGTASYTIYETTPRYNQEENTALKNFCYLFTMFASIGLSIVIFLM